MVHAHLAMEWRSPRLFFKRATVVQFTDGDSRVAQPQRDMLSSTPPTTHLMRALFEKDTPTAQCQPWCQPVDDHIRWCKCSGCEFAQSGMKIGDKCAIDPDLKCKPVDDNDLPFESCSTWCSDRYLDSHCSMCAYKRCGFCKAEIAGRKACKSYTPRGDVDYEGSVLNLLWPRVQ